MRLTRLTFLRSVLELQGRAHGLYLTLNVEQYYYYFATELGAGMLIAVHDQNEVPDMGSMSFGIPPGRKAIVSVSKRTVRFRFEQASVLP